PTAKTLSAYRNLLRRVFPQTTQCARALANSPWRILTYNYDRLFELAFRQHFDVDMSQAFYGPTMLNSGLFLLQPEGMKVDTSRFSLLKLHGGVGFCGMDTHGRCNHYQMTPDPATPVSITDETFFFGNGHGVYSNTAKPSLIVFPHEKAYLTEFPNNKFPFRAYIPEVWKAAKEFMSKAEEVWIIGYSVPEPDWAPFKSLLMATLDSCRVIIQNPLAEKIATKLRARLPAIAKRVAACNSTFDG